MTGALQIFLQNGERGQEKWHVKWRSFLKSGQWALVSLFSFPKLLWYTVEAIESLSLMEKTVVRTSWPLAFNTQSRASRSTLLVWNREWLLMIAEYTLRFRPEAKRRIHYLGGQARCWQLSWSVFGGRAWMSDWQLESHTIRRLPAVCMQGHVASDEFSGLFKACSR